MWICPLRFHRLFQWSLPSSNRNQDSSKQDGPWYMQSKFHSFEWWNHWPFLKILIFYGNCYHYLHEPNQDFDFFHHLRLFWLNHHELYWEIVLPLECLKAFPFYLIENALLQEGCVFLPPVEGNAWKHHPRKLSWTPLLDSCHILSFHSPWRQPCRRMRIYCLTCVRWWVLWWRTPRSNGEELIKSHKMQ